MVRVVVRLPRPGRMFVQCWCSSRSWPGRQAPGCDKAFSGTGLLGSKEMFSITYEYGGGERHTVQARDGDNLLDVVINNDLDIDGFGACEGTLACSTCHIVFTEQVATKKGARLGQWCK